MTCYDASSLGVQIDQGLWASHVPTCWAMLRVTRSGVLITTTLLYTALSGSPPRIVRPWSTLWVSAAAAGCSVSDFQVPISLVYRADLHPQGLKGGPFPTLLTGSKAATKACIIWCFWHCLTCSAIDVRCDTLLAVGMQLGNVPFELPGFVRLRGLWGMPRSWWLWQISFAILSPQTVSNSIQQWLIDLGFDSNILCLLDRGVMALVRTFWLYIQDTPRQKLWQFKLWQFDAFCCKLLWHSVVKTCQTQVIYAVAHVRGGGELGRDWLATQGLL